MRIEHDLISVNDFAMEIVYLSQTPSFVRALSSVVTNRPGLMTGW